MSFNKMIFSSLILGFLLSITVNSIYAGVAQSPQKDYTVIGYSYYNYAIIGTYPEYPNATTQVRSPKNVPTGYMGALPRLYKDSGVLCRQGTWVYNSQPQAGMGVQIGKNVPNCGRGAYYSLGITAAYTGSGYFTIPTYRSPSQNF